MIITLTPNPAIDRTFVIPQLDKGEVHRASQVVVAAGGKGLNVARVLKLLGNDPLAMGPLGGHSGRLLADLLEAENVNSAWTWGNNETRTCIIIAPQNEDATVVNAAGSEIDLADWGQLTNDVFEQAKQAKALCICGSLPPGVPENAPADIIAAIKAAGCPVWVDTSGRALKQAIKAKPDGVKVNIYEAAELLNTPISEINLENQAEWANIAAQQLHNQGIPHVIITLGEQGAVFATKDGVLRGQSPKINVVSSVGSGDSFFAGLVSTFYHQHSAEDALKSALAAGSANALMVGGGQLESAAYKSLLGEITLDWL